MSTVPAAEELLAAVWGLAQDARWFSGRSRGGQPVGLELDDWLVGPSPGPGLRTATLEVGYPDAAAERYLVPLVYRPLGTEVAPTLAEATVDGVRYCVGELLDDPGAASLLLQLLADGAPGFHPAREVPTGLPGRRYSGEQSNTTVFFGREVLCKVFRRLEEGRNPDAELHEALADTGTVAGLYGTWRDGEVDHAIFLETLPNPLDGYVLACQYAAAGHSFTDYARRLGEALATIHAALAQRLPTSTASGTDFATAARVRFDAAAREVPQLADLRGLVESTLAAVGHDDFPTQRIHGDCHLGQVLLTDDQWRYVDFEGEPLKSIEERRRPDTAWRDVAGMLRSFDYAAASTGMDSGTWLQEVRLAFLDGYGARDVDQRLLRALEVDKAVYEVVYESRNRPTWLHVPLDFLESLAREN
ncbi:phosphotransferase [Tessaracoccus rhinocerotis]|uniref:phosphotransferase n=1 Tax=Tessaracoccus rhinocerotis TaxID=1689449 RepID=UPI00163DC822|nr:phosphotransferase [Tessaracoccus rhinocerotis]